MKARADPSTLNGEPASENPPALTLENPPALAPENHPALKADHSKNKARFSADSTGSLPFLPAFADLRLFRLPLHLVQAGNKEFQGISVRVRPCSHSSNVKKILKPTQ